MCTPTAYRFVSPTALSSTVESSTAVLGDKSPCLITTRDTLPSSSDALYASSSIKTIGTGREGSVK